jgi:hypothetical protein
MTQKYPICPDRIRTLPQQFSWIDQRLVRDRHIEGLSHEAAALYLFLVTVADRQGLSYYSDSGIGARLEMDDTALADARHLLLRAGLIAYKKPLFQVLALERHHETRARAAVPSSEDVGPVNLREILRQISGERQ